MLNILSDFWLEIKTWFDIADIWEESPDLCPFCGHRLFRRSWPDENKCVTCDRNEKVDSVKFF